MYVFLGLFVCAGGGLSFLIFRHMGRVRALSDEELNRIIEGHPSQFQKMQEDYISPFFQWCKKTASFLFYHFGELVIKHIRRGLLYLERNLKGVSDYLHGRKVIMRKKGDSPFWDSMHKWKEGMKNGKEPK